MSRRAKLAVVALFFVVLGWLYIHTGRLPGGAPQLQYALATAARAELQRLGHDEWARVDMDGRDAVLTGIAPDEAARDAAIAAVKSAVRGGGVSKVIDETDLRMLVSPYTFEARLEGPALMLSGYAPDRGTRDAIAARAALAFAGQVDASGVEIGSGAPAGSDWLGAVDFAVAQLARLQEGTLTIEDRQMRIVGRAATAQVGAEVARQLRQAPSPFIGRAEIAAPEPIAPAPTAEASADAGAEPGADQATDTGTAGEAAAPADSAAAAPTPNLATGLGAAACQSELDRVLAGGDVRFSFNDAEVSGASQPLLDAVAEVARRCGRVIIAIGGHTDSSGDPNFNLYLSEQRARAVRDYLVSRGVDPAMLSANGYGSTAPVASNESAAGRAQNRRIEFEASERAEPNP
jgi:OOP family OmpA-OmpF porin